MPVMNWGRRNRPSSAALCPRSYASTSRATLQEGPFSHHPSVSEAVILHINGANGLTTGTKCSPFSLPPHFITLSLYTFSAFPSLLIPFSFPLHFLVSRFLSCFQHCGLAVYKSLVISLRRAPAPLRQPVLWFSLQLIFVQSDTLYVSASVSRTQFGHSEFSSQPQTVLFSFHAREWN